MNYSQKDEYQRIAREKLEQWEKVASKQEGEKASSLRASINDARAELRSLEMADSANWINHRDRVETRLDTLQSTYRDLAE